MNTTVVLAAVGDESADRPLEATRRFVDDCERRFSRFLPDSELSHLNKAAGEWQAVSADMIDLLVQSLAFHVETRGLFDPAILPALKRAGYDRSMDEIRRQGTVPTGSVENTVAGDFGRIQIDAESGCVLLPAGMEIDLGGIAKGWIVEKATELLAQSCPTCAVNAGGDMLFKGQPAPDELWQVRVEDPWETSKDIARFQVGAGAIATSSVVKRSWLQAGTPRHHLIDPRTGKPSSTDWVSVTAFAPQATTAEVYAKALLLGGAGELQRLIAQRPEVSFLAVKSDRSIITSFQQVETRHEHESPVL